MNFGYYSYLGAAIAYGFFTVLLLFSWRNSIQGKLLLLVIAISACWALVAVKIADDGMGLPSYYQVFEFLRYMAWYVFLLKLFDVAINNEEKAGSYRKLVRWLLPLSIGFAFLLLINYLFSIFINPIVNVAGQVYLALLGLVIIEQLYRNTSARYRWATKYLFLGAGGMFAFDFYFYADTLLFRRVNQELWEIRGIVNIAAVPLLAISSARNKNWSLNVFVSREVVLNTTAIMGGGVYLLLMSVAGFYIREYGGDWGRIGQVAFLSMAVVLLIVILFSTQMRARLKVFLVKHFYKNKYDYRIEWLRLTEALGYKAQPEAQLLTIIKALAYTVDARAGQLWLQNEQSNYENVASWNTDRITVVEAADSSLIRFFKDTGYVINLMEINTSAEEYGGLDLPVWLEAVDRPWQIIPLQGLDSLLGFIVLANPLIVRPINWEDRDLLKTAAKQIASHLTVLKTSDALAEARQFEVFTRLSAYMAHDLKNIASELEMVALNAKKHIKNPEFVNDAFDTVDNASSDIKRLLEQLRNKQAQTEKKIVVDLVQVIKTVINSKQGQLPSPGLTVLCSACFVAAEKDRLCNVLGHLIDNAQQATDADGTVTLTLTLSASDTGSATMCVIEIKDSGHGMDADFISNRLFKPFDTTKGNAGMGIGMYESRDFIRSIGGDIFVQSEPEKGSIISLHLPAVNESRMQA